MKKEYSMTIDTSNMEAMQSIADDLGVPVYFDESYELVGDRYCQVFSDTVEGARKLQAVYNEKVRKLHGNQCYKDFQNGECNYQMVNYKFIDAKERRLTVYEGIGLALGIASGTTLEATVFDEPVAIISIRTWGHGQKADLSRTNARDVLYLAFHDVDMTQEEADERLEMLGLTVDDIPPLMNEEHAKLILDFVEKNKDIPIICQCEAGISRSSGTAAALSVIYNGCDRWVFDKPFFKPNMAVRRKILEAYSRRTGAGYEEL